MKADTIKRLEKLLERKLSVEEKERLRTIGRVLGIGDNDALWGVVAALEYQRTYYEELPAKIAATSADILQGFSEAADREAARAQHHLAESVAELAQKLAVRINMATLLPMGLVALVSLLAYGSLMLWAGFHAGSGQAYDPAWILRMPSGLLMGGLLLGGGLFLGVHAARGFADGGGEWKRRMLAALAMLVPGGVMVSLAL
jgi:hypothetical protein